MQQPRNEAKSLLYLLPVYLSLPYQSVSVCLSIYLSLSLSTNEPLMDHLYLSIASVCIYYLSSIHDLAIYLFIYWLIIY